MDPRPTLLSRIAKWVVLQLYRWRGWRIEGQRPDCRKFVIVAAPHSSNWDFVFFLGGTHELGIRPSFMGKHTLFKGILSRFMHDMGGVPVDRTKRANYVEQIVAAFESTDELALVIAPEGSRGSQGEWRSGFWHIARGAGVPIVPAWVDHATMRGGIGEPIVPSGNYGDDLAKLAAFYRSVRPDCARFERLAVSAVGLDPDPIPPVASAPQE